MRRKGLLKRSVALVLAGVLMFNVAPMGVSAEGIEDTRLWCTKGEHTHSAYDATENSCYVSDCEHKHDNSCYSWKTEPTEGALNKSGSEFDEEERPAAYATAYAAYLASPDTTDAVYTSAYNAAVEKTMADLENAVKEAQKAYDNASGFLARAAAKAALDLAKTALKYPETACAAAGATAGSIAYASNKADETTYYGVLNCKHICNKDCYKLTCEIDEYTHDVFCYEHKITWNVEGTKTSEYIKYGETPAPEDPVKEDGEDIHYSFKEWTPAISAVTGPMEYTAVFSEVAVHTVTFGSETDRVEHGDIIDNPEILNPTRDYYDFAGWYREDDCTTEFAIDTPIVEDIEIFAKWVPKEGHDVNGDGIADEEQVFEIEVIGDVTYKITGNKIPGEEITIEAEPAKDRYITGVKVNGDVYTSNVTFKEGKVKFSYTLPTVMPIDISKCTIAIETADASVTLKSEYLNWNELMTVQETVANIIANVYFGEMPATVAENTEVKYLEYNVIVKSWKDIGATDITPFLGHKFGEKTEETVLLTFAGNDQVPGFRKEFKVKLKDDRLASKIEANDVILTYSPSVTKAEMEKAIFDAAFVAATSEDGTVALEAVYGENVFVENANVNAGTHTVTIEFSGTSEYAASSTEVTVTVKKAASYTNVSDANVKYGTEVNASALIDTGVAKRVELVAGLSMGEDASTDAKTIVYVNMPELVDTDNLPDWEKSIVDELLSDLKEGTELSISDLNKYLTGILEGFEDLGKIPGLNIDADAVSSLISVLKNLENIDGVGDIKIKLSFDGTLKLTDAGMYIVGAVVSDANYNPSFGANYVVITPDGYKAELGWNEEDKNGIITRNAIVNNTFDFGASVTKVYEGTKEDAEKHLTTFFMGVDANGEATVTYDPAELKFGVYTQIAMLTNVGNTMYYAEPIQRVFTVVPQITEVEVVNSEVVYNGESHKVNVNVNGSAYEGEGLTVTYVGVDTNGNVYNSTQAPVNTGVYTVYATYATKVDGIYEYAGFDAGVLVIKPATATLVVEDTYVDYDGNPHMPTIKNENSLELIKVIVDENNNVNVVFPFEVETKTVNVAEATAELKAVLTATGKGYATAEAISNKLVAELNRVDLEKLTVMGADELAAFIAELKEEAVKASETLAKYDVDTVTAELVKLLNKVKVNEFTVNGTLPTEDGVYEVTAIGFGANYKPALATGTLNIHKHIPAAAVKENNVDPDCENPGSYDEVVYCDNDNCGKVNNELSRVTVPVEKLGHDWADWVTTKKPTTSSEGEQRRDCNRCDDFETRPLDKLPAAGGSGSGSSNDKGTELEGVYEAPTAPTAPAATATAGASTGDSANILGYVSLFVAAGAAMVLIFFKKKRA